MEGVYTNEYCLFRSCVIPARASLSCVALSTDARINIALPYCVLCCFLQDLGGYVEDSSQVPDHTHKFTTNIDRVSPQLYYGVVIPELKWATSVYPWSLDWQTSTSPQWYSKEVKRATAVYCSPWTMRR